MSFTDLNVYLVIAITVFGGIGITLFFVGALMTVALAFSKNDKAWGIVMIILLPLSLLYCAINRGDAQYTLKYLLGGSGLILLALCSLLLL